MESRGGTSQRREEQKREDRRRERVRRKKTQAGKGRKAAIHCVFRMICGAGGSKSRLAKAAGAEPSGQMRDEKLHAVVARSAFASEKATNTSRSEHFWKLWCRKSARCCGAKHISKSKCTKQLSVGTFSEVVMSKKCTPLRGEAHHKTHQVRSTFWSWDVEKVRAVVARSTFRSQKWKKLRSTEHFWTLGCRRHKGFCTLLKREQNMRVL